jgi:hypothetical protein
MVADRAALVERLQQRLLSDAGNGGWPYYRQKSPRIEPTCWALLALGSAWNPAFGVWTDFAGPHVRYLLGRQRKDGLLTDTPPALVNFTSHALAVLLSAEFPAVVPDEAASAARTALLRTRGVRLEAADPRQDNQLQGWPWVNDTFSWIEPTAWALLALKRSDTGRTDSDSRSRRDEAERLLINRTCVGGGWNYGNASSQGQDLRAFVPTTAVGLLAMQDRRSEESVQRSLAFLVRERAGESSTMALSLAVIALHLFDEPCDDLEARLAETVSVSDERGSILNLAMAAYALSHPTHAMEAFRVRG